MFIFEPAKYARDASGVAKEVNDAVASVGGQVLVSRLWDDRRLAYPIKGHRKAPYWLTYFRANSQQLTSLDRQFRISDTILRHLFLKVDPRIADTVVSHAATSGRKAPTVTERTGRDVEDETDVEDSAELAGATDSDE
jgi:small subunit ribosomal protein S6